MRSLSGNSKLGKNHMSSEDPTRQDKPLSLEEQGCTCKKNPDGTLFMFNRHTKDDCAIVRDDRMRIEKAYRRQGW
jgi:hypothetical protein